MPEQKIQITVTRAHWDKGIEHAYPLMKAHMQSHDGDPDFGTGGYCRNCVLAQAFGDAGYDASVGKSFVRINETKYKLPKEAKEIVRAFDKNETFLRTGRKQEGFVEPTFPVTFEIELM